MLLELPQTKYPGGIINEKQNENLEYGIGFHAEYVLSYFRLLFQS